MKIITVEFYFKMSFQDLKTCVHSFLHAYQHLFLKTKNAYVPCNTCCTAVINNRHYRSVIWRQNLLVIQLLVKSPLATEQLLSTCCILVWQDSFFFSPPDMYMSTLNPLSLVQWKYSSAISKQMMFAISPIYQSTSSFLNGLSRLSWTCSWKQYTHPNTKPPTEISGHFCNTDILICTEYSFWCFSEF